MYICKTKEMYMHTVRIVSTVIMALVLMGCPPPVGDNSASGSNAPPQNGDNPDDSASQPKAIVVKQVSSGSYHSMILKTDGTLWAVGSNSDGQLGNSDPDGDDGSDAVELIPVEITVP